MKIKLYNDGNFYRSFEHDVALCCDTVKKLFPQVAANSTDLVICDIRLKPPHNSVGFEEIVLTCQNGFDIDARHRSIFSESSVFSESPSMTNISFLTSRNNSFIRKLIKAPQHSHFSVTVWVKIS